MGPWPSPLSLLLSLSFFSMLFSPPSDGGFPEVLVVRCGFRGTRTPTAASVVFLPRPVKHSEERERKREAERPQGLNLSPLMQCPSRASHYLQDGGGFSLLRRAGSLLRFQRRRDDAVQTFRQRSILDKIFITNHSLPAVLRGGSRLKQGRF